MKANGCTPSGVTTPSGLTAESEVTAESGTAAALEASRAKADALSRRGALHMLGVLDAGSDAAFDNLVMLAMEVSGASGVSLVFFDGERALTKATAGTEALVCHCENHFSAELTDKAPIGVCAGAGAKGAGQRLSRCTRSFPVQVGSGLPVGEMRVIDPRPGTDLALARVAAQAGALLDERAATAWQWGDANSVGIAVVDGAGYLMSASPEAERLFGIEPGAWDQHAMLDLIHPDDLHEALRSFQLTSSNPGLKAPFDLRMRDGAGNWIEVEVVADNRLHDPAVNGIVFTVRPQRQRPWVQKML